MDNVFTAVLFAIFLFVGMLILLEAGRRVGRRRLAVDPDGARAGLGSVDAAIFALLGLLLAFTFTGAAVRFDARRTLVIEETNDIGTAWLRLDLLPADAQPAIRESFRRYLDTRIEAYEKIPNMAAVEDALARSAALQTEIWQRAIAATKSEGAPPSGPMLLLPALNAMFDITTTRTAVTRMHPPVIIFIMLAAVALVSSLLAGYGMAGGKAHSWIHMISFAAITAISVYVILDLELPRLGLIRVENFDQLLIDLRTSMK
ncbi:MAG: DUF4239 domain-containing protein [Chthoniobacteraceae bacterium]